MARTSNVFARVEPEIKEQAERVLDQLGIPMSNAVGMFLRHVVLQQGIPFEMKPKKKSPSRCIPWGFQMFLLAYIHFQINRSSFP